MKQMKVYRLVLPCFLWLFLWQHQLEAQFIEARIQVDTTELRIGETTGLTLTVEHDTKLEVQIPLLSDSIGGMEILDFQAPVETQIEDRTLIQQQLTLIAFDSGYYRIPALDVYYFKKGDTARKATFTNAVDLNVFTVEIDTTEAFKPIKEIEQVPITLSEILAWGGVIVGILAIIGGLIWYIRKKQNTPKEEAPKVVYKIPPYEIAMRGLAQIEERRLWQKGEIKEYYIELTDVIRTYIEGEFSVPAMESVTHEIIRDLRGLDVPEGLMKQLCSMLEQADLAKFAKFKPDADDNLQAMEHGRTFLKDSYAWKKRVEKLEKEKLEVREEKSEERPVLSEAEGSEKSEKRGKKSEEENPSSESTPIP